MSQVVIQIYPKELDAMKKGLEDLGTIDITFHSTVVLEPAAPKVRSKPDFVLMKTHINDIAEIQAARGSVIDFVNGESEAHLVISDMYDLIPNFNPLQFEWAKEPVTGYRFKCYLEATTKIPIVFFLIPID